jgi:F0F1-type ATP synthase assembly protein I
VTAEPNRSAEDQRASDPLVTRGLYGGFGETLAQAFEFAIVPVLFGLAGLGLDGWLGTRPWLTVVLLVLGITGVVTRTLYTYKARVEAEEEGKPWTRRPR